VFFSQAVFVPAGQHTVRFDFRPALFLLGLLISVSSLVSLGVFALGFFRSSFGARGSVFTSGGGRGPSARLP